MHRAMERVALTEPQAKVFEGFRRLVELGEVPTVQAVADRIGMSKTGVHGRIEALVEKGYLRRHPGQVPAYSVASDALAWWHVELGIRRLSYPRSWSVWAATAEEAKDHVRSQWPQVAHCAMRAKLTYPPGGIVVRTS